jgi:1-acyl-sn-glycerol-3-phosphate acyltransferase
MISPKGEMTMNAIKVFWLFFWAVLATMILFLPITLSAFLSRTGNLAFNISKLWAHLMVFVSGVRIDIRNKEKIDPSKSYVIISNHQSLYDILALVTTLGIQFRWIIKIELLKIPLFGYALYASRNIFIDRSNRQKAIESINRGVDRLPNGVSVMFFGEGTRSPDGEIKAFKKGGFNLAIARGLPILPVTVNGSRKVLPKKSMVFKPGRIEVVVADPIETKNYTEKNLDELIEKTRNIVISNFNPDYPYL